MSGHPFAEHSSGGGLTAEASILQVAQLQKDLDSTHAHYQKLLESVAGPAWNKDPGPLERPANGGLRSQVVERLLEHRASSSDGGGAGGSGGAHGVSFAGNGGDRASTSGSSLHGKSESAGSGVPAVMYGQTVEQRAMRLEKQVESLTSALKQSEQTINARTAEIEILRDRMSAKEHMQFQEIKKLRTALSDLHTTSDEERVVLEAKIDKAAAKAEEERVRLVREAEAMRLQLAEVTGSIGNMIQGRSVKADSERKQRESDAAQRGEHARQQLAELAQERDKQLVNIKEQSAYFLSRKTEEIAALRAELNVLRSASTAEAEALKAEVEYLAGYAEKVTEVVRRLESGVYSSQEFQGIKSFKLPARDKPAPLDVDRLKYLASRSDLASALLAVSEAACPSPANELSNSFSPHRMGSATGAWTGPPGAGADITGEAFSRSACASPRSPFRSTASQLFGNSSLHNSPSAISNPAAVEALRLQWEAETKAAVTAQALLDLSSDTTVEYIRSLESQIARYRQDLQTEKKRSNDVTSALRSAQRSGVPGGALAATGVGRVLSNGTNVARPPCWGLGHGPGTASRPNSATVISSSVPMAGPAVNNLRRSTTTSLARLTSSFRDNSVSY